MEERDARGRFGQGNKIGPRFPPGESGNRSGLRKKDAWLIALQAEFEGDPDQHQKCARRILDIALKGPPKDALVALKEMQDRLGGPVALKIEGLAESEFTSRLMTLGQILIDALPREYHAVVADAIRAAMVDGER